MSGACRSSLDEAIGVSLWPRKSVEPVRKSGTLLRNRQPAFGEGVRRWVGVGASADQEMKMQCLLTLSPVPASQKGDDTEVCALDSSTRARTGRGFARFLVLCLTDGSLLERFRPGIHWFFIDCNAICWPPAARNLNCENVATLALVVALRRLINRLISTAGDKGKVMRNKLNVG